MPDSAARCGPADPSAPGIPPAPPAQAEALESWLQRVRETLNDLAQRVAAQEARLDTLTALLESALEPARPVLAHRLAAPAVAAPSPRWRRLAGRVLRAPLKIWKRLAGSVAQERWILPIPDESRAAERLRLGEEVLAIEIRGKVADLPAGHLELALLTMGVEDLFFLQLLGRREEAGPVLELWLCRREWPWRSKADLATELKSLPGRNGLLGRCILLDGGTRRERSPAALARCPMLADYWLRPGADFGIRLLARTGRLAGGGEAAPSRKVVLVTTRPLDSGLEVLVAAMIRALQSAGKQVALAATFDLRSSHRSLAEVAPHGVELYPLATFGAPELRASLLRLLLEPGVEAIWHLGPGEGFFDQPALQELLRRVPLLDLPLPLLPGEPITLGRPPGGVRQQLVLEAAADGVLLPPAAPAFAGLESGKEAGAPARAAARSRLGVPAGSFLACQMADLVPGERPEDLIELAARCPEVFFLQIGRGGLAGRRDDLLRFRGVANVRCLPSADLAEVLAAADVLLALGEPSLWPWPIFAALTQKVPVVGRAGGALAGLAAGIFVADSVREMASALAELRAGAAAPQPPVAFGADLPALLQSLIER